MLVDELFDYIETKISNNHYLPSDLWTAYIIIAQAYKEAVHTNASAQVGMF